MSVPRPEQPSEDQGGLPSAGFELGAGREDLGRYSEHMSGWTADLIEIDPSRPVQSRVWSLGAMVLTWNDFPARRVSRNAAQARADQIDHYQVHLPLGSTEIELKLDRRGESRLPSGAPVLIDLSRPYEITQGAGPTIQAYIPRELLDEMLPRPGDLHGRRLEGSTASVLGDLLQSLARSLPDMRALEAADVAKSTMHLVAASLTSSMRAMEQFAPATESTLLRQACRFIEIHLSEADLGIVQLCTALNISRATVYRLFEPYGGVASHIRERRLVRIHEEIVRPMQQQSLARISEAHGFRSAAQFSRAFRDHFGYAPKEAGRHGRTADPAPTGPIASPATYSLADWLRPLRG